MSASRTPVPEVKSESRLGLRPGTVHARAAGSAETTGGALIASGLATPVRASLLSGVMSVAIDKVHKDNGVGVTGGGYEYNVVMMASAFAITAAGPGRWSLDEQLRIGRSGSAADLAQLGAGLLGAATVIRLGSRNGAAEEGSRPRARRLPRSASRWRRARRPAGPPGPCRPG
jgi:putative oxidoreductase